MQPSVPRGNKKKAVQPVIITTENKFTPKISDRTIKKREKEKERRLKGAKYASGLDFYGVLCLYVFLILTVIIGGGGIGVCSYYINTNTDTQGWKIAGIVMSIVTCIIGVILILLTIFKQSRNRPWRYKKEEEIYNNDYYGNIDDDVQTIVENSDDDQIHDTVVGRGSPEERKNVSQSPLIHLPVEGKSREIALSPIPDLFHQPLNLNTITDDIIFCPGCNRSHPSTHQCMYSTRIANGFAAPFRPAPQAPHQDSIAIQTEDDGKKKKTTGAHTVIDRSIKYSNTTETQTNVSANPRSNITESIILRRVPIPTAKVIVQQPTTKVMIVKVPNVPGQLVIQPRPETKN